MTEYATEGRRRSDSATVPTLSMPGAPSAINDSIIVADDRLDRNASSLHELENTVEQLVVRLAHALTDGVPAQYPPDVETTQSPASPEDRRSTIAKRVADLGARADSQADRTQSINRRITAIIDNLEV